MTKALFVTGTGTDAGKTFITALIVKRLRGAGLNAGYYKAALSGAEDRGGKLTPGDAEYVRMAAGIEGDPADSVSYIYRTAVSPHLAARIEGPQIELERIKSDFAEQCRRYDYLVMEGSGGIVCPIRWDGSAQLMLEDIISALALPSIIVGGSGLGSINACVLTAEYMRARRLPCGGFILNGWRGGELMYEDNRRMIVELSGVPVIDCVEQGASSLNAEAERLLPLFKEVRRHDA